MAGGNEVSLAAIALAATAIGGVIWALKYVADTLSKDLQAHTIAANAATQASKEQKAASKEVLIFMKKLNGTLPKTVAERQEVAEKEK